MRFRPVLLGALYVAVLLGAGAVMGFCLGGLGPRVLGSLGGHGLGDLGYLFAGAGVGALLGLALGVLGLARFSGRSRLRVAVWALGLAAVVGAGTWALVAWRGGW